MLRKFFKGIGDMVKTTKIETDDPKVGEQFKNFIDNDNVMMAVYKDDEGTMYVSLSDKSNPKKCVVITAEAMYKSTDILGDVFSSKSTVKIGQILN